MLTTARLLLREATGGDLEALVAYHARNAERLARFEPARSQALEGEARWLDWRVEEGAAGRALTLVVFEPGRPEWVGGLVALDAIAQHPQAHAMLSYSIDAALEGRGLASEAVSALIAHAFGQLRLDTLVAHFHPGNIRSAALLARQGFVIESTLTEIPAHLRGLMRPQVVAVLSRPVWRAKQGPDQHATGEGNTLSS